MSREAQIVRKPMRVREHSRRTLDQRLFIRFPRLSAALLVPLSKLPPRSRIRQAALWRAARLALEAYNRRDMDAVGIGYHPEFEYHPARNWVEAGLLEPSYRGLEGHKRYVESTAEVFGAEVYVKPVELIDAGDRMAVLANVPMRAQASGIQLTEAFALVFTFEDGLVVRVQEYYDYDEALAAVGVPG
ncbi:MAG TPA: nuclear transport factor 2 family protein [Solirubrobacterales bacterium]|nr:nuclear transport factor 2 family protein [Solirubrobacterales bacterium]